jgi:hypothetical protein
MRRHVPPTLALCLTVSAALTASVLATAALAATQPTDERAAQKTLPWARDPFWTTLHTTQIKEDARRGMFLAMHSPQVKALAGQTLTITGFMLPLESDMTTTHFLLSKYTPVCFFCPPGQPNEIVEVRTSRPVKAGYDLIKVSGRFALQSNGEQGLFFRLDGASVVR